MGSCLSCDDSSHHGRHYGGHHRRHHGHHTTYDGQCNDTYGREYTYAAVYQGGTLPTFDAEAGKVVQQPTIPTYVSIDPAYVEPVDPVYVEPVEPCKKEEPLNTYEYDRYRYLLNPNTNPYNPPPYNPEAFS